jgi:excinuclease ABC subunit C
LRDGLRFFFSQVLSVPVLSHPPILRELRDEVRAGALNRPGTYRMLGATGEVLYVGKSKRVRTRLMGYFRAKKEEKGWRILREAARIEWEYQPSEFAALLRELELIKRNRPRYNVRQKRDGIYSFLKLSGGPAPKLYVVRQVLDDAATYFGPLRGGRRIVTAVRELNDVLGLRDCPVGTPIRFSDQPDLFLPDHDTLCHRFDLKRCAGPCAARCSEREYGGRVEVARAFLRGESEEPLLMLAGEMRESAERWQFERAAALRDRVAYLEMLREELRRLRAALESLSFLYPVPGEGGDDRVYAVRRGTVRQVYRAPATPGEWRSLAAAAAEHYRHPEPELEVVCKRKVDEMLLLAHWFRTRPEELERTVPCEGVPHPCGTGSARAGGGVRAAASA